MISWFQSSLCISAVAQVSRIHHRRSLDAGLGHRREFWRLRWWLSSWIRQLTVIRWYWLGLF